MSQADRNDNLDPQTVEDLNRLFGPGGVGGTDEMDARIRAEARRHFRARRRVLPLVWTGVAAAVLLGFTAFWMLPSLSGPRRAVQDLSVAGSGIAEDVDGSGVVDIVDAMRLSQLLAASDRGERVALAPGWDVTNDGAINDADVDAIAMLAVKLPAQGGAG